MNKNCSFYIENLGLHIKSKQNHKRSFMACKMTSFTNVELSTLLTEYCTAERNLRNLEHF